MTDNEILLAMSNMLDPIREEVLNIREGLREVKEDVQDIKVRVKKIEIVQENEILPRLNTIESCLPQRMKDIKIALRTTT